MTNFPEQINQTHIGVLIGGIFLYFLISIKEINECLRIVLEIIIGIYLILMLILSVLQMIKNTQRLLAKERIEKIKHERQVEIERIKKE